MTVTQIYIPKRYVCVCVCREERERKEEKEEKEWGKNGIINIKQREEVGRN